MCGLSLEVEVESCDEDEDEVRCFEERSPGKLDDEETRPA